MYDRSRAPAPTSTAKSPATLGVRELFTRTQSTTGAAPKHADRRLGQRLRGRQKGMTRFLQHHRDLAEDEADILGLSLFCRVETLYDEGADALLRRRDIPRLGRSTRIPRAEEPETGSPGALIIRGRHLGISQYRLSVLADDHRRPV